MPSAETLIAELDHARHILRQLLQDLEAQHAASLEVYPTWTIKELLAHVAGWDDACIATLRAHSRGELPATPAASGIDLYNVSTVARRAALPLEQVIQEWESTREVLKQIIRDLPAEKLAEQFVYPWGPTGDLTRMVHIFAEHEAEHAEEIRKKMSVISSQ